ncbi:MAG: asparagine synthase-related protein, partial [Flavisolibacter sp.]
DEVFAGYNKHAAEWRMRNGNLANSFVLASSSLWALLPKSRNNKITNTIRQLHRFAEGSKLSAAERYWKWAGFNDLEKTMKLFSDNVQRKIKPTVSTDIKSEFTKLIQNNDLNEVLLSDMNLVLLSDMLVKVDLMSMANSLEIRSPFLDQDVVEFAFGLPSEYKIDSRMKKKIVQDAFRNYLPDELYNRPKKGFEIPLVNWFRNELWDTIDKDLLNDKFIEEQGLFNVNTIKELKKQIRSSNPEDSHATIWALIVFQHWWKLYSIS